MNILMVAFELAPVAKVGGLADVTASLSRALAGRGHDVRVALPLYGHLEPTATGFEREERLPPLPLRVGQQVFTVRLHRSDAVLAGVPVYGVQCAPLFGQDGIYTDDRGQPVVNGLARMSCLAQAALALPTLLEWPVDVVHAHDAQAGLAVAFRRRWYGPELPGPGKTALTIHNLAHQEIHPADRIRELDLDPVLARWPGPYEFFGNLNLLKGAILDADAVNTVSPSYAREVVADPRFGSGLEGVLASRGDSFTGILNGADYETWNPVEDPLLPAQYDVDDLDGKATCRTELIREHRLDSGSFVVGMVGRLVAQKGIDLVLTACDRLVAAGMNLIVLGSGDNRFESAMQGAAGRHRGRIAFSSEFDEPLAHRIYAGCDAFLMPSAFEPCGLAQLYAMRYGTPPVVHATGGLRDTVSDVKAAEGTGFLFWDHTAEAMVAALERACAGWRDRTGWRNLVRRCMVVRFGWDRSASRYETLYGRLLDGREPGGSP